MEAQSASTPSPPPLPKKRTPSKRSTNPSSFSADSSTAPREAASLPASPTSTSTCRFLESRPRCSEQILIKVRGRRLNRNIPAAIFKRGVDRLKRRRHLSAIEAGDSGGGVVLDRELEILKA